MKFPNPNIVAEIRAVLARLGFDVDDWPNHPLGTQVPRERMPGKMPMRLLIRDSSGPCDYVDVIREGDWIAVEDHINARRGGPGVCLLLEGLFNDDRRRTP